MKERLTYIDCLKGFLILLVVLGHVVQKMFRPETFDDNLLFRMIYSFHMPAFFMVSGFVTKFCKIDFDVLSKRTVKRFRQLIVPFVTWGVIWHFTFNETTLFGFFKAPDNSLWFLWDLFWIVLVYNTALFLWSIFPKINGVFYIIGAFFTLKVLALLFGSAFGIRGLSVYFLYYIIGVLIGSNKNKILIRNSYSPYITGLMLLAFVCLSNFWYRSQCIPDTASPLIQTLNSFFLYRLITSLLGSFSFIYLFYLVTPVKPNKTGGYCTLERIH